MCLHLTTLVVLLLVIAGKVTCVDDFVFTCPQTWKNGHIEMLVCTIPVNKFSSSPPCTIYDDSVAFKYTKDGNPTTDCTVVNIDTVCNNSINLKGCGCREKTATHVTVFYNVSAARNLHENAEWNCEPQCLTSGGDQVLAATNSSACFRTVFETTTTTTPTTTEDPNNNVGQAPEKEGGIGGEYLKRDEGLSSEEKGGIGGGAAVVAIGCGSGVVVFVIKKTKIYVYLFFPPDQDGLKNYEILQKEIEKMWGVGIGKITPKDKEKYKNADYVIDISKLSGDQKQKLTELKALIVRLGGQLNCDELQAIEDAAYEPAADYPSGSLKPNPSSKRPSNGRNSVTAM